MSRYRRARDLAVVSRDGRVFLAGRSGAGVVLQGNAAVVWDCVDGSTTDIVIQKVAARAGLSDDEVSAETMRFLESLCRDGLLTAE